MPLRHTGEAEVQLHSFPTSVLTVVTGQFHAPADLFLWREPWYSFNRRPGGPHNWSGRFGEDTTVPDDPANTRFKARILQPAV